MKSLETLEDQFELAKSNFYEDSGELKTEKDFDKREFLWGLCDQDLDEANRIKAEINERQRSS